MIAQKFYGNDALIDCCVHLGWQLRLAVDGESGMASVVKRRAQSSTSWEDDYKARKWLR